MMKILLSFFAGVVLTSAVFVLLVQRSEGIRANVTAIADSQTSDISRSAESDPSDPALMDATPDLERENPIASEQDLSLEALRTNRDDAYRSYALASQEYRQALAIERWSGAEVPKQPIYLPPEFDYLAAMPSGFHEQTQREDIDPVWSAATEAQIQDYFSQRPELTQKYGYPIINCRMTKCEVAFVSYGLDESIQEGAMWEGIPIDFATELRFRAENADIHSQPWAEQFGFTEDSEDGALIAIEVNVIDDVTTILWHLWDTSE